PPCSSLLGGWHFGGEIIIPIQFVSFHVMSCKQSWCFLSPLAQLASPIPRSLGDGGERKGGKRLPGHFS
uniref:Uncharacterized protein n=1 Tax=Oryza brachyantha TaxID=4533 RepID=J3LHU8_ORYBR